MQEGFGGMCKSLQKRGASGSCTTTGQGTPMRQGLTPTDSQLRSFRRIPENMVAYQLNK